MTNSSISDFPHVKANAQSLSQRKPVHGVGVNDADYMVQPVVNGKRFACHFYQIWKNMLNRAYNDQFHAKHPTYKDCTVCYEWLYFMAFRGWMEKQDWQDKSLDKDILTPRNKIYSPETCLFVTPQINSLLLDRAACRGAFPQGVYYHQTNDKYVARVRIGGGGSRHIGYFSTPESASDAYKAAKSEHIRKVASEQSDPLRSALYRHASHYHRRNSQSLVRLKR